MKTYTISRSPTREKSVAELLDEQKLRMGFVRTKDGQLIVPTAQPVVQPTCTQETHETQETKESKELKECHEEQETQSSESSRCQKDLTFYKPDLTDLTSELSTDVAEIISKCCLGRDPLFQLAREICGLEERLHRRLSCEAILTVGKQWQTANKDHLLPDHDYNAELIDKLSLVRNPAGAVLAEVLACAKDSPDIPQTVSFRENLQLLAKLCRELQRRAGDHTFFLAGRSAARLLGEPHTTVASWLRGFCGRLGLLKLVSRGVTGRASEYRYIAEN